MISSFATGFMTEYNLVTEFMLGVIVGNCKRVRFDFVLSVLTICSCFNSILLLPILGDDSEIIQIAHCCYLLS